MEKLAAEMAAAEEAARRRAEEREREAAEQAEKAAQQAQQQQEAAANKAAEQSSANASSTANTTSGTKEEDKLTPMETGMDSSPFHTEWPHYLHSGGSPILRCWQTKQLQIQKRRDGTHSVFQYVLPGALLLI